MWTIIRTDLMSKLTRTSVTFIGTIADTFHLKEVPSNYCNRTVGGGAWGVVNQHGERVDAGWFCAAQRTESGFHINATFDGILFSFDIACLIDLDT